MSSTRLFLLAASGIACLASPDASAQSAGSQISPSVRRGMLSGAAVAVSLRQPAGSASPDSLLLSPPGDQTTPPAAFDSVQLPSGPDYTLASMFPSHHGTIRLDAFSTGNDFIGPIQADGKADLNAPFPRWQAVTVSVSHDALGGSPQSLLQQSPLNVEGPEGSLLSHYLLGSTGIPAELVNTTQLEQASSHLGFAPSSDDVIDGIDWALGVRAFGTGASSSSWPNGVVFLYTDTEFYFSVTRDWALANPTGFAVDEQTGQGVTTSGADVYHVSWNDALSTWSTPARSLSAQDLGLDAFADDVDALAYDLGHQTALYSTTPSAALSQILAYQSSQMGFPLAAVPYRGTDGVPITKSLGLHDVSDDVTAICVIDPEIGQADPYLGVLLGSLGFFPISSGLSVERTIDANDQATIHLQATGLGGATAATVEVEFLVLHPSSGAFFSVTVPYDSVRGAAEWVWPIGWVSGVGELTFAAGLWELTSDGRRLLIGTSWSSTLDF